MKDDREKSFVGTILSPSTFIMGLIDIWSAIAPGIPERLRILHPLFPYMFRSTVRLGTALIGLSLIFLSDGLRKRKKTAWVISVSILSASFVFHLIKGLDIEEAVITTALLVALIYERSNFVGEPDIPSVIQGLRALLFALLFTILYGTFGFYLFEKGIQGSFNIYQSLRLIFNTFFFLNRPPVLGNPYMSVFFDSIYIVAFLSITFASFMIFRPVIFRFMTSAEDRKRAKRLLEKFGRNFAAETMLLQGKYYYFNEKESGFIAYKPVGSYAIVLTDPVCLPRNKIRKAKEFVNFCRTHGWIPIFAGVSENFAKGSTQIGLKNILVGKIATINLGAYDLSGSQKKPLRYSVNSMERSGYSFKVIMPPITNGEYLDFKSISDYWLEHKKGKEMHFFVGFMDKAYITRNPVAVVYDAHDKIVAFVNFYEYGDKEIAIDLMRHKNVPPETMLYLFTKLTLWAKERNYKKLNLGLAMFYGMGAKGATAEEKIIKIITDRFGKIYNFKGLYVFKSKFQPNWEACYFVYPSRLDLNGALMAIIRAG